MSEACETCGSISCCGETDADVAGLARRIAEFGVGQRGFVSISEIARNLERELLVAYVEASTFNEHEPGCSEVELAERRGWNARGRAVVARLRGEG